MLMLLCFLPCVFDKACLLFWIHVPALLDQISSLPLQRGRPRLQTSAVNSPPSISALLLQRYLLSLHISAVRAIDALPLLPVLIQLRGGPPPTPSALQSRAPLFSALLPQRVKPPLQPSALHPPPLPQILAFSLQQDVPILQPLSTCAPSPPLSVSPQGRGEPPCLPSTVCAYVHLIYAFLLWKGVNLHNTQPILLLFLSFQPCLFNKACLLLSL